MIHQLGQHLIAEGDSTDKEVVKKLLGKEKVDLILTDPPYGVDYVAGKKGFANHLQGDWQDIEGDGLQSEASYATFTEAWLEAVKPHLASYNSYYIFNSDMMYHAMRTGIMATDFYHSQMLIWIKSNVVLGRKDYLPQHELIAYGWYKRHRFIRSKGKSVIFHPKQSRSKLHPTQKPVGLIRKLMENSSRPGDVVYEPFLGGGATLIASEHLKRRCFAIETNPEYVQTTIARWEKLTNEKAVKLST